MRKKDSLHVKEAFEYYYALGDERNYTKVASKFHACKRTIGNWAKKDNWQKQVELRNAENSKELQKRTDESIIEIRARYYKMIDGILNAGLKKWLPDSKNPQEIAVDIKIKDLIELVRLALDIIIDKSNQKEVNIVEKSTSEEEEERKRLLQDEQYKEGLKELYRHKQRILGGSGQN